MGVFKAMLLKDLKLELRQRYAFNGALLYVVSSAFVCYLVFQQYISVQVWNALYWIIMLFSSINMVSKSFLPESRGLFLYQYSLAAPRVIITARFLHNSFMLFLVSLLGYLFFVFFMGNPVLNVLAFILMIFLGSIGLSGILTLVSAISARSGNNFTLMAVLSFPLVLPLMMVLIKGCSAIIDSGVWPWREILVVLMLNVLSVALTNILFPYLWKE